VANFRLQPRYRALAIGAISLGGALSVVAVAVLGAAVLPLATGLAGVGLGAAYLASPVWRLEVIADDDGLEVRSPKARRFRIAWSDIVAVTASPSTHTCHVDGGAPERSLLVPGIGAPAPYDIANKQALFDAILAHVDPTKVKTVERLEKA
jgi:hypothetical protein